MDIALGISLPSCIPAGIGVISKPIWLMAAIFDLRRIKTLDSIPIRFSVQPELETVGTWPLGVSWYSLGRQFLVLLVPAALRQFQWSRKWWSRIYRCMNSRLRSSHIAGHWNFVALVNMRWDIHSPCPPPVLSHHFYFMMGSSLVLLHHLVALSYLWNIT